MQPRHEYISEEYDFLSRFGVSDDHIASQLGISTEGLKTALKRCRKVLAAAS